MAVQYMSQIIAGCFDVIAPVRTERKQVQASYDAARDGNETVNIWANTDVLDADASNSLAIRTKLRKRDRYERGNNGHKCGIHRTQANFVVGTGPTLRMKTKSSGFNAMVESKWKNWAKAVQLPRKLRQLNRAKTGDGEALAIIFGSDRVSDPVGLDFRPIECDRLTAPVMVANDEDYVDGVHFENGVPVAYDILRRHPGASWYRGGNQEYDTYPANSVCHWYFWDRSEQHRGIPEMTATLNLFPTARRFREATVAAAETAADYTLVMQMGAANDGNDEVAPFTTLPVDKRTMLVSPAGATAAQLRAEHPATTYEMFNKQTLSEEARPISMPLNIASCDSSGYSYSGGQLDHHPYFTSLEIEQQECESDVLEKVFGAWFSVASFMYGWVGDAFQPAAHEWGWPGRPHNDPVKTATARKIELSTGQTTMTRVCAEDGVDVEDHISELAAEYGKTELEIRDRLFEINFGGSQPDVNSQSTRPDLAERKATNETVDGKHGVPDRWLMTNENGNGHARVSQ